MLGAAIVPDGNGARGPVIAHGKARVLYPVDQIFQHGLAFRRIHFHQSTREVLVHVERLLAGLWMHPDHRMNGHLVFAVMRMGVVQCAETVAKRLHGWRQLLVGLIKVGPHGVATKLWAGDHVQNRHDRRLIFKGDVGMPFVSNAAMSGR